MLDGVHNLPRPRPQIPLRDLRSTHIHRVALGATPETAPKPGSSGPLRNWLYHGQRQFFGIAGLRSLLDGNLTAIAYSHELTASVDSSICLVMCVAFPLFALALAGMAALGALGNAAPEQDGDPPEEAAARQPQGPCPTGREALSWRP